MTISIRPITEGDLPDLVSLESKCWPVAMRLEAHVLRQTLVWEHTVIGAFSNDVLIGLVAARYGCFDPNNWISFPTTFAAYFQRPSKATANAALSHSLNVDPAHRCKGVATKLIRALIDQSLRDGMDFLVAVGRCPSYNGSNEPTGSCEMSPQFRAAMDRFFAGGEPLKLEEYLADPLLRYYHRLLQCQFCSPLKDFLPEDKASGGHNILFYKKLRED